MNESDQNWGVTECLFLECLGEGIPRRLYQVWEVPFFGTSRFGVPLSGSKTPPVGDRSSSWLLSHDEKNYVRRRVETTNGPDKLKRDQHP